MSKTYAHVFSRGHRAVHRLTPCERLMWMLRHPRRTAEDWIAGERGTAGDFVVLAFAAFALGAALAVMFAR